ncbi:NADPH dehydrogenase NamA [Klebsiella pneumoniae]|uniref:NADPH dehydrogenase NamA n=1 Tax=Klebsiella pneumoniae TaxID=573 RepID=UPI001BABD5CC|nr:NADPH dehydrogenase NamA [Klebsiella pneumoniae]MBQ5265175.1 NADPH dehydrogenase NamA [Klebsiella pneumoniae]
MSALLFEPITINGVKFKNRIIMSPMCMHSADKDGNVTDFHLVHYGARALGGASLVFPETCAVQADAMIGPGDLGIWQDSHIEGLSRLVDVIHKFGAKAGVQIGHAGRQVLDQNARSVAPSAIPFTAESRVPEALTAAGIAEIIEAFAQATIRATKAGFDVVEIHAAHGFLINEFLSPLANQRTDEYGGSHENRYRFLRQVIDAVRAEWKGPLFVRISSSDYKEGGNTPEDFLTYGKWMKEQGVDLIDCSSGGIAMVPVATYAGYQVPAADLLRNGLGIKTGAVGMIETGRQAEEILRNGRADMVLIGREFLKDPFWPRSAADNLNVEIPVPPQYTRYGAAWQRYLPRPAVVPFEETVEK